MKEGRQKLRAYSRCCLEKAGLHRGCWKIQEVSVILRQVGWGTGRNTAWGVEYTWNLNWTQNNNNSQPPESTGYVAGTVLTNLCVWWLLRPLQQPCEARYCYYPFLQIKELRHWGSHSWYMLESRHGPGQFVSRDSEPHTHALLLFPELSDNTLAQRRKENCRAKIKPSYLGLKEQKRKKRKRKKKNGMGEGKGGGTKSCFVWVLLCLRQDTQCFPCISI